jgi:hypothetical protein
LRIQDTLTSPILGVSTQPQLLRRDGVCSAQVNMRANKQISLRRRPILEHEKVLWEGPETNFKHFWYQRQGVDNHVIVLDTGRIVLWSGNTTVSDTFLPTSYFNPATHTVDDLLIESVNDTIFIINKKIVVGMDSLIVGYYNQPTHINITTALNYEDTLNLTVSRVSTTGVVTNVIFVSHSVTPVDYSGTSNVDYSIADKSRSTQTVAQSIADQINDNSWGGFLGPLGSANRIYKKLAEDIIIMGGQVGNAGVTGWGNTMLANSITVKNDIQSILDAMAALPGAGHEDDVLAMNLAQADLDAKTIAKNNAYTAWQADIGNAILEAAYLAALALYNTAVTTLSTATSTANASAADPAAQTALWVSLKTNLDSFQNNLNEATSVVVTLTNQYPIVGNSGIAKVQTMGNNYQNAKTMYAAGEVSYEELSNGGGFRAVIMGTNVSVYANGVNETDTVQINITSGQGEKNAIIVHPVTSDIKGLPKNAISGSIVEINPDPSSSAKTKGNGVYYLIASPVAKGLPNNTMTEVIWKETVNPWIKNKLNRETMPHSIRITPTVEYSWIAPVKWRERIKGDEVTCPNPSFIGNFIKSVGYFQKRLVFLSGNNCIMSETDDIWNFFKASAVKTFVTDPVDIASSATGVDELEHITTHNKEMLLFSRNAQFKIPGNAPVTPETTSMALTTKYDTQTKMKPVSAGNFVYFGIDYGDSAGIYEYTAQPFTGQDASGELTKEVLGYMPGTISMAAANPNLNFIACRTDLSNGNKLFVADRFKVGNEPWNSWSEWIIGSNYEIKNMYMTPYELHIVVKE